jgi:hypothetical protein
MFPRCVPALWSRNGIAGFVLLVYTQIIDVIVDSGMDAALIAIKGMAESKGRESHSHALFD